MTGVYSWWDDAVAAANDAAAQTQLRHKVTVVRHYVEGTQVVLGWRVDLADGEHRRRGVDAEFWGIVAPLIETSTPRVVNP